MENQQTYAPEMHRITTYISRDNVNALNAISKLKNVTKSDIIRDALSKYSVEFDILEDYKTGFYRYKNINIDDFIFETLRLLDILPNDYIKCLAKKINVYDYLIINSPRQSGKTILICLIAAYYFLIKKESVTIYSLSHNTSINTIYPIVNKIIHILDCSNNVVFTNKTHLTLKNSSTKLILSTYNSSINLNSYTSNSVIDFSIVNLFDDLAFSPDYLITNFIDCILKNKINKPFYIISTPYYKYLTKNNDIILSNYYRLWLWSTTQKVKLKAIKMPRHINILNNITSEHIKNEYENEFLETIKEYPNQIIENISFEKIEDE